MDTRLCLFNQLAWRDVEKLRLDASDVRTNGLLVRLERPAIRLERSAAWLIEAAVRVNESAVWLGKPAVQSERSTVRLEGPTGRLNVPTVRLEEATVRENEFAVRLAGVSALRGCSVLVKQHPRVSDPSHALFEALQRTHIVSSRFLSLRPQLCPLSPAFQITRVALQKLC